MRRCVAIGHGARSSVHGRCSSVCHATVTADGSHPRAANQADRQESRAQAGDDQDDAEEAVPRRWVTRLAVVGYRPEEELETAGDEAAAPEDEEDHHPDEDQGGERPVEALVLAALEHLLSCASRPAAVRSTMPPAGGGLAGPRLNWSGHG